MTTDTVEDPNLVPKPMVIADHVTYLLEQANVADTESWKAKLHPEALTSTDIDIQRFHVNRCWIDIFTSLRSQEEILETRNARGCLMGRQCPLEDWSRLFAKVVIPCAIQMGLLTVKN